MGIARYGLQIVAQAIMARILGPEVYGIFGIGLIVIGFFGFFSDFGFGWIIVYKKTLTDLDVRFIFTCQLCCGLLVGCALFFGASSVASYFKQPDLEGVLHWLAIGCVITSATAPGNNLLMRGLRFKASGSVQFFAYLLAYSLIGVPMALAGFGLSALVAPWVTMAVLRLIGTYWLTRHPIRPLIIHKDYGELLRGGRTVFMTNIVNWLLTNFDRVMLGRVMSAHFVGLYTISANLANTPNSLLLSGLQPAFLSAGAKMQDSPDALRLAYQKILSAAMNVTVPIYICLSALAPSIIGTLYGERWSEAAPLLGIFLLAMPSFILWGISTPILWNTGRSTHEAIIQLPIFAIGFPLLLYASDFGVIWVACVSAVVLASRGVLMVCWACRAVNLRPADFVVDLIRGASLGVLCAGAAATVSYISRSAPAVVNLAAGAITSIAFGILLVRVWPAFLGGSSQAVLKQLSPRLTRFLVLS